MQADVKSQHCKKTTGCCCAVLHTTEGTVALLYQLVETFSNGTHMLDKVFEWMHGEEASDLFFGGFLLFLEILESRELKN